MRVVARAIGLAVLLAGCGPSPDIPSLDEPPPQANADESDVGTVSQIEGWVVDQAEEFGEPFEEIGTGATVAERIAVLAVDRRDGLAPVEVLIPRGYVDYPPPDVAGEPLAVPDERLRFTVRLRSDGRYECASPVCVTAVD
ncbi:hypothetical protein [Demequina pelophila]|uniref:hypothetical protein n=1 Tax=Demequina pelophila TaxID=1638984 RepID=UPI0007826F7E|nr:hypothetical protein [Demequina pelophila]